MSLTICDKIVPFIAISWYWRYCLDCWARCWRNVIYRHCWRICLSCNGKTASTFRREIQTSYARTNFSEIAIGQYDKDSTCRKINLVFIPLSILSEKNICLEQNLQNYVPLRFLQSAKTSFYQIRWTMLYVITKWTLIWNLTYDQPSKTIN